MSTMGSMDFPIRAFQSQGLVAPVVGGATPTTVVGAGSLAAIVGSSAVVVGCSASTRSVSGEVDDGSSLNPFVGKWALGGRGWTTTTSTDPGVAFVGATTPETVVTPSSLIPVADVDSNARTFDSECPHRRQFETVRLPP